MHAHLVQFDIAWEDPAENFARVDRLLRTVRTNPGDLIVLPEMFDTGFSLRTEVTADNAGRTLAYLLDLASDTGCVVLGGRTIRPCDCDKASNVATIVAPGAAGTTAAPARVLAEYAKVHPFSFGREPESFRGGPGVVTFPWAGLRVCPIVCYDLRFPELFRAGLQRNAEVFAVIANWPVARAQHWRALCIARAIENQAFVLGVNRTGQDPHLGYAGGTLAIDPKGRLLGELGAEPGVLSILVDGAELIGWRQEFPAWRDGRVGLVWPERAAPGGPSCGGGARPGPSL